jgi:hypothetical protein
LARHGEADVHRPVRARRLPELARPVQRVHDPDPLALETQFTVGPLFGEETVGGKALPYSVREELVRASVALMSRLVCRHRVADTFSDLEQ